MSQYNGWANKATWLVRTWLGDVWTGMEDGKQNDISFKDWAMDYIDAQLSGAPDSGLISDFLQMALADIDWDELDAFYTLKDEYEDDEDEEVVE